MSIKAESRLLVQLNKERGRPPASKVSEKRLEDLYHVIAKLEPNNLKLLEYLIISLDKGLFTNAHGLKIFCDIFEEFSLKAIESETTIALSKNPSLLNPDEEKKFHKHKFIKLWPELARRTHPGDESAYERIFYTRLVSGEVEDIRFRFDDHIKKLIKKESMGLLLAYEEPLQRIFTIYSPENYNRKLSFSWTQLRLLNRRLPVLCCLRFLVDAQVCPSLLSYSTFFQVVSKCLPPSTSNHKETLFYNSQTINNYAREHLSSPTIRLLDGDIGLAFHEFQLLMMRISIEMSKEHAQKGDIGVPLKKLLSDAVGISSASEKREGPALNTTFTEHWTKYKEEEKHRAEGESLLSSVGGIELTEEVENASSSDGDIPGFKGHHHDYESLKRILDEETPRIPEESVKMKENTGIYNMDQKCIVIGEQPPKILEKVKMAPKPNKKEPDELLGQKPEVHRVKVESDSHFKELLIPSSKPLKNNALYPILLSQPISYRNISPEAELYIETAFISLFEHNYESSKENLKKAKSLQKVQTVENELFFLYVEGQISEATGEDGLALGFYVKCLEVIQRAKESIDHNLKALPYFGIGGCLFHSEEYEYALRCFLKAKELQSSFAQKDSEEVADLLNNLGCCYLKLERATEAKKYFSESYRILDSLLGVYHERTLVVLQNLNKSKKCYVPRVPEYKNMWRTFIRKEGLPPPKKK